MQQASITHLPPSRLQSCGSGVGWLGTHAGFVLTPGRSPSLSSLAFPGTSSTLSDTSLAFSDTRLALPKRHTNMPTPARARVLSQSALAASDLCRQSGSSAVHRGRMQTLQQAAYIKMHVHVKRRRCSQFPIIIMLEHLACQLGVHRAWLLAETRPMTLYTWSRALGASETTSKSPR